MRGPRTRAHYEWAHRGRGRKLLDLSALGSILLCSHSLVLSTSIYLLGVWHGPGPFKDMKDRAQKSLAAKLLSIHGGGRQGAGSRSLTVSRRSLGGLPCQPPLPPAFPQPCLAEQSAPVGEPA